MSEVDFGRHSDDYAEYRPGFPASFYRRLDRIHPIRDTRSVDIATGPGVIALELAARESNVVGIDVSAEQVATATAVSKKRGLQDKTRFEVGTAESTGLPDDAYDLVTAGQCWHWFDSPAAMAESLRILRPGGTLAIAHYSYLAEHAPVAKATEDLVMQFNPAWTMSGWTGIFPELIDDVIRAGFELAEQFCYHHTEEFSHARWRGRIRTCNGVGSGGLPPSEVPKFDDALSRLLEVRFPEPLFIDHRVWCVVARKPAGS